MNIIAGRNMRYLGVDYIANTTYTVSDSLGGSLVTGGFADIEYQPDTDVLTVGVKGLFKNLQDAVKAALSKKQFSATQDTVFPGSAGARVTCTNNSYSVTGDANTWFIQGSNGVQSDPLMNGDRYFSVSTGPVKKWYKIAQIVSDTQLLLDSPFQESTITTANVGTNAPGLWWSGKPNTTNIVILDAISTGNQFNISSDGSNTAGGQLTCVALRFVWPNKVNFDTFGGINIVAASGVIEFDGMYCNKNSRTQITPQFIGADTKPVVDFTFNNCFRDSVSALDWVYHGKCGSMRFNNVYGKGEYDTFLPDAAGTVEFINCVSLSIPKNLASNSVARAMGQPWSLGVTGGKLIAKNTTFEICSTGAALNSRLFDFTATQGTGSLPSQCVVTFDHCTFNLNGSLGGNPITTFVGIALGITDSDIYFNNCSFSYSGTLLSGANNYGIGRHAAETGTANRLYFNNTAPWDIQNDNTLFTVAKFSGAKGRPKALTQPIAAAEFDFLRGDTFTLGPISAARTIPPVVNAPNGAEITFILSEDGTAGHVLTWDASFHFTSAFTQSVTTTDANKVSQVTFRKSGSNWYQMSPANSWLA